MPTATPFNNLITFSRGSNATVTGSNGLIQYAPNNLLLQSESFDAAAWTKSNATTVINTTVAPDGTTTADKIVENTANAWHGVKQSAGTGVIGTFSFYAKAAERSRVWVAGDDPDFVAAVAVFNLSNGTVQSGAGAITDVGNGWYRCSINATISARGCTVALANDAGTVIRVGDGTSGVLLWGAQLELGSAATTYNPTTVKNLLGFSEAFDNAAFTKLRASIVTGAQANPVNGLFNAQKLMEDTTASNTHLISQGPTLTAAPHVLSVYVKAAGRNWFALVNNSIANVSAFFDLANGVVGTVGSAATASITNVGSGWYRCSMAFTAIAATNNLHFRLASANGTDSYTGDGNSGVYIYGAQLSDSASLDPYVPTPGAAPSSTAFYGPRFDFDPVTLQPRGILIEEQRTNLLLRSEEFGNVYWSPTGVTVTSNSIASPDGAITADTLVEDTSTGVHRVFATPSCSASTTYTFSAYVKAAGRTQVRLLETTLGGAFFDLSAVTVITTDPGVTASITNAGNGWYRCRVTSTTGGAQTLYVAQIQGSVAANNTYTGSGAAALYVWGAQLEAGAFATSYIPTVASTVTRSADVATITGQNFGQWYRQDEGAFVALFDSYLVDTNTRSALSAYAVGATSNNILLINAVQRQFQINNAGNQADLDGGTPASGAVIKAAGAYRLNDFALSLDAGSVVTDTVGTVPTVDALGIGVSSLGLTPVNGHIRNIRFIPARAADFQLQGLST